MADIEYKVAIPLPNTGEIPPTPSIPKPPVPDVPKLPDLTDVLALLKVPELSDIKITISIGPVSISASAKDIQSGAASLPTIPG